jgi:hypothetical protein
MPAADFGISQVVDVVTGIHAPIRISDLALEEGRAW